MDGGNGGHHPAPGGRAPLLRPRFGLRRCLGLLRCSGLRPRLGLLRCLGLRPRLGLRRRLCLRLPALAAAVALLAAATCAPTRNYSDPSGPRWAAEAPAPGFGAPPAGGPPREGRSPGSVAGPSRRGGAGERAVRVVTFNIRFARAIDRAIELLATHPDLRGADILCLQEMDEAGTGRIAAALGLHHVYYPATVHPAHGRNFGNAILSRWPIRDDRKILLPHLGRFRHSQRIAVAGTVSIDGEEVRVYSLHAATPFEVGPRGRREQIQTVLADALRGPAERWIVAGDFNFSGTPADLLRGGGAWPTRGLGPTFLFWPVDHIVARGLRPCAPTAGAAGAGVVRDVRGASDHRPVWAVFTLPRGG